MRKIKDRFVAGIVVGLMANTVKQAIEWTASILDISQETGSEKAAGFFLEKGQIKTPMGRVIGVAAYGVLARWGASSSSYRDPKTTLVSWVAHTAFELAKGYLLTKIYDPSMFGKPYFRVSEQAEMQSIKQ